MEFEDAVMVDCSRTGICIELPRALELSSSFLLKPCKASLVMLVYEVRRCTPRGKGYDIGAEYGGFVGTPNAQLDRDGVLKMLLDLESAL
jgi:hypothetical protein